MLKMRLKWQLCKSSKWKPLAWSIWGPTIRSCCQLPRHPSVALSYLKRLYQMHLRAAVVIKIPPNLAHFEPKRHSAAICWQQMISFKKKSCLCFFSSFCNKYWLTFYYLLIYVSLCTPKYLVFLTSYTVLLVMCCEFLLYENICMQWKYFFVPLLQKKNLLKIL